MVLFRFFLLFGKIWLAFWNNILGKGVGNQHVEDIVNN